MSSKSATRESAAASTVRFLLDDCRNFYWRVRLPVNLHKESKTDDDC